MPSYEFNVVSVFIKDGAGGNPLAVVLDAQGMTTSAMQAIATRFNYSESAFVFPPRDQAHSAHVRIFTPTSEIPFAGHPNVGVGFLLGHQATLFGRPPGQNLRFEELAGIVEVCPRREAGHVTGASITAPRPLALGPPIDPALLARCGSITINDLITTTHHPIMASVGLPFAIAETTLESLARAKGDVQACADADERYKPQDDRFSVFLYAAIDARRTRFRARMFAPLSNIEEDPATGSACGALGALLLASDPRPTLRETVVIEQGIEMGSPCEIEVTAHKHDALVTRVDIAGRCRQISEGQLTEGMEG